MMEVLLSLLYIQAHIIMLGVVTYTMIVGFSMLFQLQPQKECIIHLPLVKQVPLQSGYDKFF